MLFDVHRNWDKATFHSRQCAAARVNNILAVDAGAVGAVQQLFEFVTEMVGYVANVAHCSLPAIEPFQPAGTNRMAVTSGSSTSTSLR